MHYSFRVTNAGKAGKIFLLVHYMLIEPHEQNINIPLKSVLFVALPRASLYDPHADDFITATKMEMHHSGLLSENILLFVSEPSCN